jgi:hypothetical protein
MPLLPFYPSRGDIAPGRAARSFTVFTKGAGQKTVVTGRDDAKGEMKIKREP